MQLKDLLKHPTGKYMKWNAVGCIKLPLNGRILFTVMITALSHLVSAHDDNGPSCSNRNPLHVRGPQHGP